MALGEYVTVKQLQAALNMSRSAIYQASTRGFLPQGIKIGHAHRWRIDEVNVCLRLK